MVDNEAEEICSAEFPNSAAVSISIYNAIKSAAVSRIANPDTPCGRITNAPELEINPTWPPLSKGRD